MLLRFASAKSALAHKPKTKRIYVGLLSDVIFHETTNHSLCCVSFTTGVPLLLTKNKKPSTVDMENVELPKSVPMTQKSDTSLTLWMRS